MAPQGQQRPPPAPNTITFEGFLHLLHVLRQERKGRSAGDVPSSPLALALAQEGEAVAVAVQGAGACSSGGAVGSESASAEGERLAKALQPEASLVLRRFFNVRGREGVFAALCVRAVASRRHCPP